MDTSPVKEPVEPEKEEDVMALEFMVAPVMVGEVKVPVEEVGLSRVALVRESTREVRPIREWRALIWAWRAEVSPDWRGRGRRAGVAHGYAPLRCPRPLTSAATRFSPRMANKK